MKNYSLSLKTYRFDYKSELMENNQQFIINHGVGHGTDPELWIGIKWRIYAVNKNNEEVFGYLGESRTLAELETKEKDFSDIKMLFYNSFVNVEMAFQEKLRLPYNIFGTKRPDFD